MYSRARLASYGTNGLDQDWLHHEVRVVQSEMKDKTEKSDERNRRCGAWECEELARAPPAQSERKEAAGSCLSRFLPRSGTRSAVRLTSHRVPLN